MPEEKETEAIEMSEDENPERGNWSGKLDFLLSCLGYAVGLGNVWRFPYLCYLHGGGAFLIPYTVMLFTIGIPCFFLEISIGQYSSMGPITLYKNYSPLFKGIGFANFVSSCFVGLFYNMVIAWTIYYTFASMASPLPWIDCQNDFNSPFCFSVENFRTCNETRFLGNISADSIYHNGSCISDPLQLEEIRNNKTFYYGCELPYSYLKNPDDQCSKVYNHSIQIPGIYVNTTKCKLLSEVDVDSLELFDIPVLKRRSSAGEYLSRYVLNESSGIDEMGEVQWHLALCLLAAWIVIFLCLFKGIKSSGKVVYFTATFPYLILVILLIRAVTLPGAERGIYFYMVPKWERLNDIEVWKDAASQIFFSLSVAGGGLVTLASYNTFHNNVVRDTLIVCFGNCLTSVFAGFAIFSVLGFLATQLGVEVEDVVKSGTGLAFEAYPDLVSQLTPPPLWSILFFIMLFTLGLDSQFAITETILTGILDYKPHWRKWKTYIIGIICIVGFLVGLPLTTRGGGYLLDLLNNYATDWPLLFIGLSELIIVAYVYGIQNFLDDLNHLCGFKLGFYTKSYFVSFFTFVSPLLIFLILMLSLINHKGLTRGDYVYPSSAIGFGLFISLGTMLSIPIIGVGQIIYNFFTTHQEMSGLDRLMTVYNELLKPTKEWRHNAERAKHRDQKNNEKNGIDNLGMSSDLRSDL